MGKRQKIWFIKALSVGVLMLFGGIVSASENTIYVINNNAPTYNSGGGYGGNYGGGIMCTEHGGICATGRFMMSTSRVRYAPPQWKRPTIRERRLSEGKESVPYAYRQAYYR